MLRFVFAAAILFASVEGAASTLDFSEDLSMISKSEKVDNQSDSKNAVTNPARVYPPSCHDGLAPDIPFGPGLTGVLTFLNVDERPVSVQLNIWRKPCSSTKSAVLLTLDSGSEIVTMPSFRLRQGGKEWSVRLSAESNTEYAAAFLHATRLTYFLEIALGDYQRNGIPDINSPFELSAQYAASLPVLSPVLVPGYTPSQHADVPALIPFNGRMTGAYFQPGRGGEGILLEVAEAGQSTILIVSWYTFDTDGFPFWLTGAAPFTPGDTSATIQLSGKLNGRFAGDFDPSQVRDLPWGEITVSFPDCNTLSFSYRSTHSTQGLPTGSGTRNWSRLSSVKRFGCS